MKAENTNNHIQQCPYSRIIVNKQVEKAKINETGAENSIMGYWEHQEGAMIILAATSGVYGVVYLATQWPQEKNATTCIQASVREKNKPCRS